MNNISKRNFTTNIFGDSYLPAVNGKKFDEIAYSTYFDIDILAQLSKEFTFYIFIGTDSGMMLNHLKQLNIDPSSIYQFVEASEIKNQLSTDLINIKQPNILISTIDNWQDEAEKADIIKYIEVDRVQVIKSFSAKDQIYPVYASIAQKLHDDINQLKWIHPDKFQKKIYIQRQIENSPYNINPAIQLKDRLKSKPALILAGGPSLDNYIDWIEEHQENYIVIAVSRLARRLFSTNIVPDIFVTADPFESAYNTSKEVLAFSEKSILVHQSYAHPKLVSLWQGQQFYFGDLLPWKYDYNPENIKGIGPTVTNGAIHLAIQMGIIEQILFGVDLCYSAEGYSHVSQTIERDHGADLGFAGTPVTTNNGEQANTTYEMLEARTSITVLAELAEKQGGQIINPSPSSAAIKNVSYLPLSKIKTPTEEISSFVGTLFNTTAFTEHNPHHNTKLLEEYKKLKKEVQQILNHAKEIVDICSLQYEKQENNLEYLNKISVIECTISAYSKIVAIIESFGINGYYDFTHPDKIKAHNNELDIVERYYNSLYIACNTFLDLINESIKKINAPKKQDLYQEKNKTNQIFISKPVIGLENLEKKLYSFFLNKNKAKLIETVQQVSAINSEQSTSLTHLSQGYRYELDNEIDQAINEYLNANHNQTLEGALKRVLAITLKQGEIENTVTVLKALSDISPEYLIQLANLYQISEQYKDALDTYSLYIDQNPDDVLILIKMGLLYFSLDILDGAEFIFKHILEIDLNNQTALVYLRTLNQKSYNSAYSLNNINIENDNTVDINEYNFFKQLNEDDLDIHRLENAERLQTIGFVATRYNIKDNKFTTYIKKIYQYFTNINFVIFYFDEKIKAESLVVFKDLSSKIQYKKPKNIYELVEEIEIYIIYTLDPSRSVYKHSWLNEKIKTLRDNCKNIFFFHYRTPFVNSSLDEISEFWRNNSSDYQIMYKKCASMGMDTHDLEIESIPLAKTIFTYALNYKTHLHQDISYQGQEVYYIKIIDWITNNKNMIHFFYYYNKISI